MPLLSFIHVLIIIVLGSTPDLWSINWHKRHNEVHIAIVGSWIDIYHVFSDKVGGVELGHEVVGVGVLVGVLLGGDRDLLHAVIYA